MLGLIVLFAAIFSVHGQTTSVSQCTRATSGALPINTHIEGCITPPCILPQGQDVVLNIVFKAPRTIQEMRTLATAYMRVGFIEVPIPYPLNENAVTCNFLTNSYCPVMEGEVVQYQLRMFIEESFPAGTQATIEFLVQESAPSTGPVFCVRVPIQIVRPIENALSIGSNDIDTNDN